MGTEMFRFFLRWDFKYIKAKFLMMEPTAKEHQQKVRLIDYTGKGAGTPEEPGRGMTGWVEDSGEIEQSWVGDAESKLVCKRINMRPGLRRGPRMLKDKKKVRGFVSQTLYLKLCIVLEIKAASLHQNDPGGSDPAGNRGVFHSYYSKGFTE